MTKDRDYYVNEGKADAIAGRPRQLSLLGGWQGTYYSLGYHVGLEILEKQKAEYEALVGRLQ